MAYRRKGRTARRSYGRSRTRSASGYRSMRGGGRSFSGGRRRSAARSRSGSRAQTVRLVIQMPNTQPVFAGDGALKQGVPNRPRKAQF